MEKETGKHRGGVLTSYQVPEIFLERLINALWMLMRHPPTHHPPNSPKTNKCLTQ